jgi:hypothetical protein
LLRYFAPQHYSSVDFPRIFLHFLYLTLTVATKFQRSRYSFTIMSGKDFQNWLLENAPKMGGYVRNPEDASQGIFLPDQISSTAAKSKASKYSASIFSDWKTLQDILDRHEESIRTRWAKKSGKNRKQLLLDIWPKMPQEHHPEWKAMAAAAEKRGLTGPIQSPDSKYRDTFLLPNLNLEDLSGPRSFLVLLNARARNAPDAFAFSDYQNARVGVQTQCIKSVLIDGPVHKMRIIGHTSPATYGEIYALREGAGPNAGDVDPSVGLVILETQSRILNFVVKCAKSVLHDIAEDQVLSDAYPKQPALFPLSRENGAETVTIPSLSEEGPYHVPHAMDFEALLTLTEAKRNECEDNMWALREDPGYFAEMALSRAEHRQESVLDVNGQEHPFKGTPLFWDRILSNLAGEVYNYLMSWTIARDFVKRIKALHHKHAQELAIDKPLPKELEIELLAYKEWIDLMQESPLLQLNSAVPGSPELRGDWLRDITYPDPNVCHVMTKTPVLYDYLLMLFTILADGQRRETMGLQNILDEIERTIRRDPKQKARISPMVAQMFGDLALTGELDRQLKMYQPRLYEPFYQENSDLSMHVSRRKIEEMGRMMKIAEHMDEMHVAEEGTPKNNRFDYPADQPRTKETVEQMRLAESKLDKFWAKVDKLVLTRARRPWRSGLMLDVLSPAITSSRSGTLQRTAPWVEPIKPMKEAKLSVAEQQYELELRTQRTLGADGKPQPKAKAKRRGVARVDTDEAHPAHVVDNQEPEEQVFKVNKRAYKVFMTLFHSPLSHDRPGEIAWMDFLHAMVATSFTFEKLYGSVWQFTPTQLDVERAINFHEPHPEKKIPLRMARRYGGRLHRAYGWSATSFRLE